MEECSILGQSQMSNARAQEVRSPVTPKLERKCKTEATPTVHSPSKGTQPREKANWKKIARQQAQNQTQALDTKMLTSDVVVGSQRLGIVEFLEFEENRAQKRLFIASSPRHPSSFDSISVVAAMQHRQEQ